MALKQSDLKLLFLQACSLLWLLESDDKGAKCLLLSVCFDIKLLDIGLLIGFGEARSLILLLGSFLLW